ncbi:MAG: 2-hydroxyacid dehydrogenase [Chitinophagaceae bacterium]|nr:2-hydroxyacid dehydrogenase [Chitinophagaceae bacterium]
MKIAFFSTQPYDISFFNSHKDAFGYDLIFFETALDKKTASLAGNAEAVCVFVNDKLTAEVIDILGAQGVKIIALRCAGFNNVDLEAAKRNHIQVCRVPAYSPEAVAEHAVAMMLTLNRKTHKAYNRVREQNFSLNGLLGFDVHNKTIGVIGTGNIGKAFCKIMLGFGCKVAAFDVIANKDLEALGVEFKPLMEVLKSDIISLHCPLNDQTKHIINENTIAMMKKGVMIINTSRGGLIDTTSVIQALKSGQIAYLGIDVYEQEEKLFFRDLSSDIIQDDLIQRLMSFPNVLITAHQAFFTEEALNQISVTTLKNIKDFHEIGELENKAAFLV